MNVIVVENGFAYTTSKSGLVEFLKAREAGQDVSIGQFGAPEIGDCLGDITNLPSSSARVLLNAIEAYDRGQPLTGVLASFSLAVEAIDSGLLGDLPAFDPNEPDTEEVAA